MRIPTNTIVERLLKMLLGCFVLVMVLPSPLFATTTSDMTRTTTLQDGIAADISATLEVTSAAPSTDSLTEIEVSGTWPTSCVPKLTSIDAPPHSSYVWIMVAAKSSDATCAEVETDWEFSLTHQFTMPGYHRVELVVVNEEFDTENVWATQSVEVSGGLSFLPKTPEPNEPFTVSVSGVHNDGCVPRDMSYAVSDTTIVIDVLLPEPGPCAQVISPWQLNLEIEGLDEGEYTIEVYKPDWFAYGDGERMLFSTREISVGVATAQASSSHYVFLPGFMGE